MAWIYDIGVQRYLTPAQVENNANEFFNFFYAYGASIASICGMLGNIQQESSMNPGMKQSSSINSGWGLIQWTPSTVLTNWCNKYRYNWYDGGAQCERIVCEGEGTKGASGYWLPTTSYPYSWTQFLVLLDVEEATKAYLEERERAGTAALSNRIQYARQWYEYFTGQPVPPTPPPTPPTPPTPPSPPTPPTKYISKMPLYMMLRKV